MDSSSSALRSRKQEEDRLIEFSSNPRKTVVVQGLGFVGAAMLAALANACDENDSSLYNVIGVDLGDVKNYWKIARVLDGTPPVDASDQNLKKAYAAGAANANLTATDSLFAYTLADFVVVDIHLDIVKAEIGDTRNCSFDYESFSASLDSVFCRIRDNCLVVLETTVPPGTTAKIVYPQMQSHFKKRGINVSAAKLVHSYERVMPGPQYLNSITNFYRVYSGMDQVSADMAHEFFASFIDVERYPLTRLEHPNASETAKLMENSYRALNIAFIQEWVEFAHEQKIDLFAVVEAIRMRPTHANMMYPGFGVGGYCLTKDPLLAEWSRHNLFASQGSLELSLRAVAINDLMPSFSFELIAKHVPKPQKIALLGVSYRDEVADTRYSPSDYFVQLCQERGIDFVCHDPMVKTWRYGKVQSTLSHASFDSVDVVVVAVRHAIYQSLDAEQISTAFCRVKLVVDGAGVLPKTTLAQLKSHGIKVAAVGRGEF